MLNVAKQGRDLVSIGAGWCWWRPRGQAFLTCNWIDHALDLPLGALALGTAVTGSRGTTHRTGTVFRTYGVLVLVHDLLLLLLRGEAAPSR